jgi:glycosyltransferase involved in cell wall biosynthesis
MRIAIVLPRGARYDPANGTSMETVVRTLSGESRFAAATHIVCEGDESDGPTAGVVRVPAGLGRAARNAAVIRALERLDPDLIEFHQQLKAAAQIARRFPDKIRVLHRHTRIKPPANPLEGFRYRSRLRAFDRLVFVSRTATDEFIHDYPALAGRVSSVCNPIDAAAWRGDPADRDPVVLFAGRAMPEKGLDTFCLAIEAVLDRRPDWRATLLLGDWERHQAWAGPHVDRLARFGARVRVVHSAPLEVAVAATRRAAVAVTPSRVREALGLTALEAHAGGAALISSGRGGLREASGDHAIYVDPDNVDALVGALCDLIDDPGRRLRMARAAQAFVTATHNPAVRAAELDGVRAGLAARRARTGREALDRSWFAPLRRAAAWLGSPHVSRPRGRGPEIEA